MKITKFILFLLTVFIFVSGCASDVVTIEQNSTECLPSDKSCYTVMADEHLQEDHKVAILQALNEWSDKTHNTLTYKLTFKDMSAETQDNLSSNTIKIYVKDPGPGYLGWTAWSESNHSAYTLVEPSINGELFRRIMLHELGHAFALDFNGDPHYQGPYESVMHPSIGDDSTHLSCPELQAFCSKHSCQVDCQNVSRSNAGLLAILWKETKTD